MQRAFVLTVAALLLVPGASQGQQPSIVARDAEARMYVVAPGVYAILHDPATVSWPSGVTAWPHGNTGVIVGAEGVLVVDATYLPSRAAADIQLIRQVTRTPVRYLVNTHWHGDHTHGNAVYRDSFPDLVIIGQEANADWIATNQARYPALVNAGKSDKTATLAQLEGYLAAGRDSSGALDERRRAALRDNIRLRQRELAEFRRIRVAPPTLLFDDRLVLDLGDRRVELWNWGRANSPADVAIFLPSERVLFTGDVVVHPVPFVGASHPLPWIAVLQSIERLAPAIVVPGHGPVMADLDYVRLVREMFEATRDRVQRDMRAGYQLQEIVERVSLADFRGRFVRDSVDAEWWDGTPAALVERMHQCVQGYRC